MGTVELNIKAPAGSSIIMRTAEWAWDRAKQGRAFEPTRLYYDVDESPAWTPGMIAAKIRGGTYCSWSLRLPAGVKMNPGHIHLGVPTLLYVARGDEAGEVWHPSFAFHPYRYVEVQGLTQPPSLDLLTGLVITSDEEVVGSFTSGNPHFNDIWEACMNSTRYTTHGMAWDNATERLQSQLLQAWSAHFASYVLWYPNLWRKNLEDLRLSASLESDRLAFHHTIYGNRWPAQKPVFAVTQSVNVELPLQYYARYGDRRELAKSYPYMKAWVEAFFPNNEGKIINEATMGAWCDHFFDEASADGAWVPEWDRKAMMSMLFYQYARQTAAVANILGKPDDAASLNQLAENIRSVINSTWYNAKTKTYGAARHRTNRGEIDDSTGWHGLMATAIAKGVAPQEDIPEILDNCIADMKKHYNGHYAAGHITHPILYDIYSDHGMIETCYDMMNDPDFPGFAWMLQSGNKTIPEGPAAPHVLPALNSACQNECQNPARWFTETVCGVSPDLMEPAFKHVLLRPRIPSRLPSASLVTTTPYGELESSWTQRSGTVSWTVRIPANSYATAWIPAKSTGLIRESGQPLTAAAGCEIQGHGTNGVECRLGSGSYTFEFPTPDNELSQDGAI